MLKAFRCRVEGLLRWLVRINITQVLNAENLPERDIIGGIQNLDTRQPYR